MQFNRTQGVEHIAVTPCRTFASESGEASGIMLHLDDRAVLVMTVGEAQKLVADINGAIRKTTQVGSLLACDICGKPANTVKHGVGFCAEHVGQVA